MSRGPVALALIVGLVTSSGCIRFYQRTGGADQGHVDAADKADLSSLPSLKIVLNTTATGANVSASVTDFPLLVRLTQPAVFAKSLPGGADIRFIDGDGVTVLPHEIEQWDPLANQALVWVRVPVIAGASAAQFITLRYGNPALPDASNGPAVFPPTAGFVATYHVSLNHPFTNSSSSKHALTNHGCKTTPGLLGANVLTDGSCHLDAPDDPELEPTSLTLSAWVRPTSQSLYGKFVCKGQHFIPFLSYTLENRDVAGVVGFQTARVNNTYVTLSSGAVVQMGTWYHLVGTFDAAKGRSSFYLDGQLVGSDVTPQPIEYYTTLPFDFVIGGQKHVDGIVSANSIGAVDEVRLERVARSAAWVALSYENQRANQALITFQ